MVKSRRGKLLWPNAFWLLALAACAKEDKPEESSPAEPSGFRDDESSVTSNSSKSVLTFDFVFYEEIDPESIGFEDFLVVAAGYGVTDFTYGVNAAESTPNTITVTVTTEGNRDAQYTVGFRSDASVLAMDGSTIAINTAWQLNESVNRITTSLSEDVPNIAFDRDADTIILTYTFSDQVRIEDFTESLVSISIVDENNEDIKTPTISVSWNEDVDAEDTEYASMLIITLSDVTEEAKYEVSLANNSLEDQHGNSFTPDEATLTLQLTDDDELPYFQLDASDARFDLNDGAGESMVVFRFAFDRPLYANSSISANTVVIREVTSETTTTTISADTADEYLTYSVDFTTVYYGDNELNISLVDTSIVEASFVPLLDHRTAAYTAMLVENDTLNIVTNADGDERTNYNVRSTFRDEDGTRFTPTDAVSEIELHTTFDLDAAEFLVADSGYSINRFANQITFTFAFDDYLDAENTTLSADAFALTLDGESVVASSFMVAPNLLLPAEEIDGMTVNNAPQRSLGALVVVLDVEDLTRGFVASANLVAGHSIVDASGHTIALNPTTPLQISTDEESPEFVGASADSGSANTAMPILTLTFSEALFTLSEDDFQVLRTTESTRTLTYTETLTADDGEITENVSETVTIDYGTRSQSVPFSINSTDSIIYTLTLGTDGISPGSTGEINIDEILILQFVENTRIVDLAGNPLPTQGAMQTITIVDEQQPDPITTTIFDYEVVQESPTSGLRVTFDSTAARLIGNNNSSSDFITSSRQNDEQLPSIARVFDDADSVTVSITLHFDDYLDGNTSLSSFFFLPGSSDAQTLLDDLGNNGDATFITVSGEGVDRLDITLTLDSTDLTTHSIGVVASETIIDAAGNESTITDDIIGYTFIGAAAPVTFDLDTLSIMIANKANFITLAFDGALDAESVEREDFLFLRADDGGGVTTPSYFDFRVGSDQIIITLLEAINDSTYVLSLNSGHEFLDQVGRIVDTSAFVPISLTLDDTIFLQNSASSMGMPTIITDGMDNTFRITASFVFSDDLADLASEQFFTILRTTLTLDEVSMIETLVTETLDGMNIEAFGIDQSNPNTVTLVLTDTLEGDQGYTIMISDSYAVGEEIFTLAGAAGETVALGGHALSLTVDIDNTPAEYMPNNSSVHVNLPDNVITYTFAFDDDMSSSGLTKDDFYVTVIDQADSESITLTVTGNTGNQNVLFLADPMRNTITLSVSFDEAEAENILVLLNTNTEIRGTYHVGFADEAQLRDTSNHVITPTGSLDVFYDERPAWLDEDASRSTLETIGSGDAVITFTFSLDAAIANNNGFWSDFERFRVVQIDDRDDSTENFDPVTLADSATRISHAVFDSGTENATAHLLITATVSEVGTYEASFFQSSTFIDDQGLTGNLVWDNDPADRPASLTHIFHTFDAADEEDVFEITGSRLSTNNPSHAVTITLTLSSEVDTIDPSIFSFYERTTALFDATQTYTLVDAPSASEAGLEISDHSLSFHSTESSYETRISFTVTTTVFDDTDAASIFDTDQLYMMVAASETISDVNGNILTIAEDLYFPDVAEGNAGFHIDTTPPMLDAQFPILNVEFSGQNMLRVTLNIDEVLRNENSISDHFALSFDAEGDGDPTSFAATAVTGSTSGADPFILSFELEAEAVSLVASASSGARLTIEYDAESEVIEDAAGNPLTGTTEWIFEY